MIERLFATKYHQALKWLGNKDWLEIGTDPDAGAYSRVREHKDIPPTPGEYQHYTLDDIENGRHLLKTYCTLSSTAAFYILSLSRLMAQGPKLFRPTLEQCLALENTEANVTFDFYQQPYDTVVIELPKEYRERINQQFGTDQAPIYVIVHKVRPQNVVAVTAWFNINNMIVNILAPREGLDTLEDAIIANRQQDHRPEFKLLEQELATKEEPLQADRDQLEFGIAEIVQRLGINFSLMMTLVGVKVGGPVNQKETHVEKNRKLIGNKKADPEARKRARRLLDSTVFLTELNQNITFYDVEQPAAAPAEEGQPHGTHKSPKPHWRKGHFRMQPYGPMAVNRCGHQDRVELTPEQCAEIGVQHPGPPHHIFKCNNCGAVFYRKLQYIKPVLVMERLFLGDLSKTFVQYTTKKPQ